MSLSELARSARLSSAQVGGKAAGLARLRSADLPVPDGFVVHVRENPAPDALAAKLAALDGPFVVRSSATCEDQPVTRAPGIFRSYRDTPAEQVADRIADVRASLASATAQAYLETRQIAPSDIGMAVIVQQQITGCAFGTSYSRDPDDETRVLIEADFGKTMAAVDRASKRVIATSGILTSPHITAIVVATLAAEELFAAPVDVEWVIDESDRLWLVQARLAPESDKPREPLSPEALAFSRAEPQLLWTWDAAHNPSPLSLAQAGLVRLVDENTTVLRQRVVAGYLYTAPGEPAHDLIEPAALPAYYARELLPRLEAALAPLEGEADLERVLEAYVRFCQIYADELSPSLAAARAHVGDVGAMAVRDAGALRDHADHLFSVWDVAAPALSETPDVLARAATALRKRAPVRAATALRKRAPVRAATALRKRAPVRAARSESVAQAVANIAEEDDLLFARAQAGVRRALRHLAGEWQLAPGDIFYVELDDIRDAARAKVRIPAFSELASVARKEQARQGTRAPPLHIIDGQCLRQPRRYVDGLFVGRGFGGLVRGRVAKFPRTEPLPKDAVLVSATVIPPMAALAVGVRALVTEQGGLLSHGAALARELQIPCVVGAIGAANLSEGTCVLIDGQAGLVLAGQPRGFATQR